MMLAHISCKRLMWGDFREGLLYEDCGWRWSGANACGDEYGAPVSVVIDVGRDFTMSFDGKLYVTGKLPGKDYDPALYKTFTVWALLKMARRGRYGFLLLFDEAQELEDARHAEYKKRKKEYVEM